MAVSTESGSSMTLTVLDRVSTIIIKQAPRLRLRGTT